MPRRDGTGPMGQGSMTGRGMGTCPGTSNGGIGAGMGRGRGMGMGFASNQGISKTQKEMLQEQRNALKNQLNAIDEELEDL